LAAVHAKAAPEALLLRSTRSREPISMWQSWKAPLILQMQHPSYDAVVAESVVEGAADMHGHDRQQHPARPQVYVGPEYIQFFVLMSPVRQFHRPPQHRSPPTVGGGHVPAHTARDDEDVQNDVIDDCELAHRGWQYLVQAGLWTMPEPYIEQDDDQGNERDANVLVQLEWNFAEPPFFGSQRQSQH